jgi:hypothetical protein
MTLAEYFALHRPRPRYQFGDRVEGRYMGIPWVGTAYTDNLRNETEGVRVSIHLDLPIKLDGQYTSYIRVEYKDIKGLRT